MECDYLLVQRCVKLTEVALMRPILWDVCLLHNNELPFKAEHWPVYLLSISILVSVYLYQYTCISILVSVHWYLYLVFVFLNTDTDTSYFKNVLEYWYFQYFSVSVFLKNRKEITTWYMIIPKIKCKFTPLFMAVIIDHFQIWNSILLGCLNWPFMIMEKVIRNKSD